MVRDVVLVLGAGAFALGSLSLQERTMQRLTFISDAPVLEVEPELQQVWLHSVYARCEVGDDALSDAQAACLASSLDEGTAVLPVLVERLSAHYLGNGDQKAWTALMDHPPLRPRGIGVGPALLARDLAGRIGVSYDFACERSPSGERFCWEP